ncbi:precorrin-6y C5,15-methyltransferase (decarboxylating) subunit CbiE [Proteocatella sphenisci]|uniref:precorrin-6y C5,15-methyltransferase (decarboxylating) subunit CbiE n=1 Tax=Proteocatella sphenisci TaxID=181070 RepID=UPI00048F0DBD|nr:precorrin-6y C5,15-methyltransferase (decarboxylating) subunit CbiE [Proteocatella sphenisci]
MKKTVRITGIGMGTPDSLTKEAIDSLANAQEIIITDTLAKRLNLGIETKAVTTLCKVSEVAGKIMESHFENIVVPVSGDTGFFSLSRTIEKGLKKLKGEVQATPTSVADDIELEYINGISSMQYFFAKTGGSYDDVKIASAHGRNTSMVALASYNKKVFALTGGDQKVHIICKKLADAGLGDVLVTVGENLGSKGERIISASAKEISNLEFENLAVMLIENVHAARPFEMLRDIDFERAKVPMTKEEVRWISAGKLDIRPSDIVYDIGAGTGSVTIEMARKACESTVYAIERNPEATELIRKNMAKTGSYNIELFEGRAPEGMETWPEPDRVFIGGSSGNLRQILESVISKTTRGFIAVINTVTLETLTEAFSVLSELGFKDAEYLSITAAKSQKTGSYNMMIGANPVYIITAKYDASADGSAERE